MMARTTSSSPGSTPSGSEYWSPSACSIDWGDQVLPSPRRYRNLATSGCGPSLHSTPRHSRLGNETSSPGDVLDGPPIRETRIGTASRSFE
jgi:hypothetical protein